MDTKVCMGYNSKCKDDKHILLLDYDVSKSRLKDIENNLFFIQKKFDISTFYIINSTNGYNAISLSKLTLPHIVKVRSECKYTDALHNKIGYKRRGWVLRIGEDKKCISIVCNFGSAIEKSNAHRILLNSYYDIPIQKDNRFDNYDTILFEKYIQKRMINNAENKE
jgi:hypothetical protein